jgi:hypothetical protein
MKRKDKLNAELRKAVDGAIQREADRIRARIFDPAVMARMSLMYHLTEGI